MIAPISGFSKLSKKEKIDWLAETYLKDQPEDVKILRQYWNENSRLQQLHDEFTENTLSNFYLPFGLAPNFLINGRLLALPMAIEESSVIAAASKAAKFWRPRGGFKATVLDMKKVGQVHFFFRGSQRKLQNFFQEVQPKLIQGVEPITRNMVKRGGGILDIELRDKRKELDNYFQLHCEFDTRDSMGANFINSCLEKFAAIFKAEANEFSAFSDKEKDIEIIMSILSNFVPDCLVRAEVNCPIGELSEDKGLSGKEFAERFIQAVRIAELEPYRAVTHNKGAMNGVDAVVLATGNDFRAVEAGVHAFASREGSYTSLSKARVEDGVFRFWIELPLALGTVGGLTSLHPLVKLALDILQQPSARQLMEIVAVAGLAQNFAAVRSLVTTGIQQGHMKMHLMNILNQYKATKEEKSTLTAHFKHHTVTHASVLEQLNKFRNQ